MHLCVRSFVWLQDSGAFYTGRQWQQRGNVVRGNTFSHVRAQVPTYLGYPPFAPFICTRKDHFTKTGSGQT
jgi:hypothetical protein